MVSRGRSRPSGQRPQGHADQCGGVADRQGVVVRSLSTYVIVPSGLVRCRDAHRVEVAGFLARAVVLLRGREDSGALGRDHLDVAGVPVGVARSFDAVGGDRPAVLGDLVDLAQYGGEADARGWRCCRLSEPRSPSRRPGRRLERSGIEACRRSHGTAPGPPRRVPAVARADLERIVVVAHARNRSASRCVRVKPTGDQAMSLATRSPCRRRAPGSCRADACSTMNPCGASRFPSASADQ